MQLKKGKQASYIRGVQIKEVAKTMPEASKKTFRTGRQGYRKFSLKKQALSHAEKAEKHSGRDRIPDDGSPANIPKKESKAARTEEGKKYTTGMEVAAGKNNRYRHEGSKDAKKENGGFLRKEQERRMVLEQHQKKSKPSFVGKHGDIKLQEKLAGTSYKATVSHCQKETRLSSTGKDKFQNFGRKTGSVNQDQPTDIKHFPLALAAKTKNANVPDGGKHSYFVNLPKKQLSYVKNPKVSFSVVPVHVQTATREKTLEESGDKEEAVQYKGNRGIPKTAMVSAVLIPEKRKNVIKGRAKAERKKQAFSPVEDLLDAARANRGSSYQKFHRKKKHNVSGYLVKGTRAAGHIAEKTAVTASNICYAAQKTTGLMKQEELIPGILMMDTAGLEGKAVAFLVKKGGKLAVSAVKSRIRGKEKNTDGKKESGCAKEKEAGQGTPVKDTGIPEKAKTDSKEQLGDASKKEAGQAKAFKEADTPEKMKPDMQHMAKTGTHAGQGQRNSLNSNELLIQKDKYHIVDAHYGEGLLAAGAGSGERSLEDKYHISREKTGHDPHQDVCSDEELTERKARAVKEKKNQQGKKRKRGKLRKKDPMVTELKKKFMVETLMNPENEDAKSGIGALVCQIAQIKAGNVLIAGSKKLLGFLVTGAVSLFASLLSMLSIPLLIVLLVFGTCAGAMAYLMDGESPQGMAGQYLPNAAAQYFSDSLMELYSATVLHSGGYELESLYYTVDGEADTDAVQLMGYWRGTKEQVSMLGTNFPDVIMLYLVKAGAAGNQGDLFFMVGTEEQRQLLKRCYQTLNCYRAWQKFRYETDPETGEQNLEVSIDFSVKVWHLPQYLEQNPDYFTQEEREQYQLLCEVFEGSEEDNSGNGLALENYITFAQIE